MGNSMTKFASNFKREKETDGKTSDERGAPLDQKRAVIVE